MTELSGQPPKFGGSTGGLLSKANREEKYAITWTSASEQVFEMPTGGAAIMNEGENLLYLARKEQCLALGTQLRTKFTVFILAGKLNTCTPPMAFSPKKSTKVGKLKEPKPVALAKTQNL